MENGIIEVVPLTDLMGEHGPMRWMYIDQMRKDSKNLYYIINERLSDVQLSNDQIIEIANFEREVKWMIHPLTKVLSKAVEKKCENSINWRMVSEKRRAGILKEIQNFFSHRTVEKVDDIIWDIVCYAMGSNYKQFKEREHRSDIIICYRKLFEIVVICDKINKEGRFYFDPV